MEIQKITAEKEMLRFELTEEETAARIEVKISLPLGAGEKGTCEIPDFHGKEFSIPRYEGGYDRLYCRFLADADGTAVMGANFVTDFGSVPEWNYDYPQPETKKALECTVEDAHILGVRQSMYNINLPEMMASEPSDQTVAYRHNAKEFYFYRDSIARIDAHMKCCHENGVLVTAILLNSPGLFGSRGDQKLLNAVIHPGFDAEAEGTFISAFNLRTEEGQDYYRAFVEFLAERYAREDAAYGRICGMVISNEVDSQYVWSNSGELSVEEFTYEYTTAMRSAWQAAGKHYRNFRIYMSLDHFWTLSFNKLFPKRYYSSKDIVDLANRYSKEEGDFDWNIAHHPYPEDLRYPDFYNDRTPEFHFETPRITFKNIEVLPAYLAQESMLYRGRTRRIILSEQGFNSRNTAFSEQQGAAAYCLAYQKVKKLDAIDLITHHAYVDNPHEFGLNLGVRRYGADGNPGEEKPIYFVMRDMDTEREEERIREAREFIGEELFDSLLNPDVICGAPDRSKDGDFGTESAAVHK